MTYGRLITYLLVAVMLITQGCSTGPGARVTEKSDSVADKGKTATSKANPQAQAAFKRALHAIDQDNDEQAINILTDMAEAYPDLSGSHTNLGLIYFRAGDLQKAEAAFRQAIRVNPGNAVAYNHLGILYRMAGRFSEAENAYLSAIQNKPDYANAHLNLGILYDVYLRRLDVALRHYKTFQSLQPEKDMTVKNWIIGLKRRARRSK